MASPAAGLTFLKGAFYGTTADGGGTGCESETSDGCGTVYSVSTRGKSTCSTIQRRHGWRAPKCGTDRPRRFTLRHNDCWWHRMQQWARRRRMRDSLRVSSSGEEHTLYRFKGTPDGEYPDAGLTLLGNTLYGTTSAGGKSGSGQSFASLRDDPN